jgi:hypothetical protein
MTIRMMITAAGLATGLMAGRRRAPSLTGYDGAPGEADAEEHRAVEHFGVLDGV